VAPPRRVVDLLLKSALGMRVGLCRGAELHGAADVVAAGGAVLAALARKADLEGDAVTGGEVGHGRADSDDGAGGLVAEGQGLADDDVAVAEVVEVVKVGAAEAGSLDGDLDLIARGGGEVTLLLGGC
jgi:hypothetical protein